MYDVEFTDVEAEVKDEVVERWSFVVVCSVLEVEDTDGVLEAVVVEVVERGGGGLLGSCLLVC